jgi:hypothetical protein
MADSSYVSSLRSEILESQKARIDLLKYKLIAAAALGAIGIGAGNLSTQFVEIDIKLVLAIIPLVCVYVDLLCWHNSIRILIIGRFLNADKDSYELFLDALGNNLYARGNKESSGRNPYESKTGFFFRMEDWALHWSTIIFSISLLLWGIAILISNSEAISVKSIFVTRSPIACGVTFVIMGLIGTALSLAIRGKYRGTVDKLFEVAPSCITSQSL